MIRSNWLPMLGACVVYVFVFAVTTPAQEETQTFDSEALAAGAGWLANEEGQNPDRDCDACETDLGWKDSNLAGAAAGEGGGLMHRSGTLPIGFYADTTIGELTLEQPIRASGKIYLHNIDFNGHAQFGFFDADRLLEDPLDFGAEMGFRIAEPGGGVAPNFRWGHTFSTDAGDNEGDNNAFLDGIPDGEAVDFSIDYDPEGGFGFGAFTLTIGDEDPLDIDLEENQRLEGATFTGFGVFTGTHLGSADSSPLEMVIDDVTYTSTEGGGGAPVLQPGDSDRDFDFDQLDLVLVQQAAKYLTGQAATWGEGDWDGAPGGSQENPPPGNGRFDQLDIIKALAAGIYLTGPYAVLSGPGQIGDGQTSITYDRRTGELGVDAPAGVELTSLNVDSATGIFTGDPAQNLGGSFDNDADNNLFKATFGSSFGSLSFGAVAQPGLPEELVRGDLTVVGSLAGGGGLGDVDLIYIPEPSTVLLLVLAWVALFGGGWRHVGDGCGRGHARSREEWR